MRSLLLGQKMTNPTQQPLLGLFSLFLQPSLRETDHLGIEVQILECHNSLILLASNHSCNGEKNMTFVCSIIRVCGIIPGRGSLVPAHQPGAPFFPSLSKTRSSLVGPSSPVTRDISCNPRGLVESRFVRTHPATYLPRVRWVVRVSGHSSANEPQDFNSPYRPTSRNSGPGRLELPRMARSLVTTHTGPPPSMIDI